MKISKELLNGLQGLQEKKQEWQTYKVAVERVVGEGWT